uniref:Uncharacterized protein n=1 Tax=Globodera pallida TaxID=36090 RepID=A0A183C163_GLOPA
MYEAQQKTRQLQHNYYSEELAFGDKGFVPKPSRNRKANTQMEQYLNQLEKKGLECYFSEMKQRVFGEVDKRRTRNERRQHSDDYDPSRHFSSKKRPPKRIGNLEKNKANANEPSFSEAFAVGGGYESGSTMCSSRSSTASSRKDYPKLSLSTTAANHQRNLT